MLRALVKRTGFDYTNAMVAFVVWLVAVIVYWLTKAPTLSFWDCGEFIAASHVLGVPHPPGTPLYVLFGRLISLIPFQDDIATRVNALSSLSNAFTAMFGYLVGVRLLRRWFAAQSDNYSRLLLYAGPAAGAFFLAFGFTQWNNSIEAEVYGLAMMLFMAILWLGLVYYDHRGTPYAERIMLLAVYLSALGIGVHMATFMALPAVAFLFILKKDAPGRAWFVLAGYVVFELYLIFALSSRPGEVAYYVPVIIVLLLYAFYVLSFERITRAALLLGGGLTIAILPLVNTFFGRTFGWISLIGIAGLTVTSLYALYLLMRGVENNETEGEGSVPSTRVVSVLVLSAVVMVLLLQIDALKGYTAFLWLTVLGGLAMLGLIWRWLRLPVLVGIAGASLIIIGVRPLFWGLLVSLVVIAVLGWKFKLGGWRTAMLIPIMMALGFSVHVYLPVRSAQHPAINENNPSESLNTTISFLERKQYGSQAMVPRMFVRRASWEHQFGVFQRMGFWHFFHRQWGLTGTRFFILLLLGLFGIWEILRRRHELGLVVTILLLLSSVGLILYMNFADGTRQNPVTGADYLEVRDRDYFFTPAFVLFGLTIGLGITALVQFIRESVRSFSPVIRRAILAALPVAFLLPIYALAGNYYECDRSRNYIPYDYAADLLNSADPNAVLFTAGDNDTFPLWCVQEVYGVRKDVVNVNLSLANTHWYIEQLRDDKGLNISWTNEQIRGLRPYRLPDGRVFRIQDQVIDEIIANNSDNRPIDFSITCPSSARKYQGYRIDSLLDLSGLKFRLRKTPGGLVVRIDETLAFYNDSTRFRLRGSNDPSIYKDPATRRVVSNIGNSLLTIADTLRSAGEFKRAEAVARMALDRLPFLSSALYLWSEVMADEGKIEEVQTLIDTVNPDDPLRGPIDTLRLRVSLARAYRRQERPAEAALLLQETLDMNPSYRRAFDELMRIYVQANNVQKIVETLRAWVARNPNDRQTREMLRRLETGARQGSGGRRGP